MSLFWLKISWNYFHSARYIKYVHNSWILRMVYQIGLNYVNSVGFYLLMIKQNIKAIFCSLCNSNLDLESASWVLTHINMFGKIKVSCAWTWFCVVNHSLDISEKKASSSGKTMVYNYIPNMPLKDKTYMWFYRYFLVLFSNQN